VSECLARFLAVTLQCFRSGLETGLNQQV
jgi:hypothetical protein